MEESLAPAASVVEVARRHILTVWRRQARSGAFGLGRGPRPDRTTKSIFAAVLRCARTTRFNGPLWDVQVDRD
jgi:transposase-like protein